MSILMEDFLSAGQVLVICLLICVFLTGKAVWQQTFSKLPPGPWGMPVIGKLIFEFFLFTIQCSGFAL